MVLHKPALGVQSWVWVSWKDWKGLLVGNCPGRLLLQEISWIWLESQSSEKLAMEEARNLLTLEHLLAVTCTLDHESTIPVE